MWGRSLPVLQIMLQCLTWLLKMLWTFPGELEILSIEFPKPELLICRVSAPQWAWVVGGGNVPNWFLTGFQEPEQLVCPWVITRVPPGRSGVILWGETYFLNDFVGLSCRSQIHLKNLKSLPLEGGRALYDLKMVNVFDQKVILCFLCITEEKVTVEVDRNGTPWLKSKRTDYQVNPLGS